MSVLETTKSHTKEEKVNPTNDTNNSLTHFLLLLKQYILFVFDFIRLDILKNTVIYETELWAASSHLQKYDKGVDMSYSRQPSTSIRLRGALSSSTLKR